MNKTIKLVGVIGAAGIVAAGGSAFTDSNDITGGDNVAGYGTDSVTGATTSSIEHTLSADGTKISSTALTFTATQASNTVQAGFGTTSLEGCDAVVGDATGTLYTCTYAGVGYDTVTATDFRVAVN